MLDFGDIFYLKEKEYVNLFFKSETLYAAIILNKEDTDLVKRLEKLSGKKGTSHQKPLLCYVELTTSDYNSCSANMLPAANKGIGQNFDLIRTSNKKLDENDLRSIKEEIIENKNLFNTALVEFLEGIPL